MLTGKIADLGIDTFLILLQVSIWWSDALVIPEAPTSNIIVSKFFSPDKEYPLGFPHMPKSVIS